MRKQLKFDQTQLPIYSAALKYYVGILYSRTTDHQYYEVLTTRIIPLMRRLLGNLHAKWMNEKTCHQAERDSLEKKAKDEIRNCFFTLRQRLQKEGLLELTAIRQRVCIIEVLLECRREELPEPMCSNCGALREEHRAHAIPGYIHSLHDFIKCLCYEILNLGRWDLLVGYARVTCSKQYGEDMNSVLEVKLDIDRFTFSPSFYALIEFDEILDWHNRAKDIIPAWVAWDTLSCIEWASLVPRDFLRKKNLKYNDTDECDRSVFLLYLHGLRAEVKAIKNKRQNKNKVTFFARKNIENALKIVFRELWPPLSYQDLECKESLPYAIELVLEDHIELRLKIEWEPGIVEFCHIHSFQELDYKPLYDFIEGLYDNPGEFQEISPKLIIDGGNAKQFLKKAAIDGVLYRLFIALGITRYGAILRKKRIVISDESKDTLKALSGCIQKLKNIRWEPSLKNYK